MRKIYKIVFFISLLLTIAAITVTAVYGLRLGVDFRGGSVLEIAFSKDRPPSADIEKILTNLSIKDFSISYSGDNTVIIKTPELTEQTHQLILSDIKSTFSSSRVDEKRFDSIGPTIGQELKNKSITAIVIVLISIIVYIAIVFRKLSRVLSSWAMGTSAVLALIHDISIPIGVFALLGRFQGIEISAVFVAAVLTILGYSVSDTVVVFDRVRENIVRGKVSEGFGEVVHRSIMQTLSRSLNTTFTTLLSLIAIYFFGGESVKFFALALIIGIFLGAYSSIFVASPLLVWWTGRRQRAR